MSLQRFFLEDQVISENVDGIVDVALQKDDLKHLKAARVSIGELVAIIDASTDYFQCEVTELTDQGFKAKVSSRLKVAPPPFTIDLFQGVPKAGKLEDVVRHGTEIGIEGFYPLACKRSVAKLEGKSARTKIERLNRIAKSAASQSGRDVIPVVHAPVNISQASNILESYDACIVFWEEAPEIMTLHEALKDAKDSIRRKQRCKVAAMVGPEGGIDESEISYLLDSVKCARLSTLGPNVLRTETAGVVGCALISYELGGMGASWSDAACC